MQLETRCTYVEGFGTYFTSAAAADDPLSPAEWQGSPGGLEKKGFFARL